MCAHARAFSCEIARHVAKAERAKSRARDRQKQLRRIALRPTSSGSKANALIRFETEAARQETFRRRSAILGSAMAWRKVEKSERASLLCKT